ncbi:MAG TPA: hypothetical protein VMG10_11155 [Gemmataceae bacterium]|nr:hypothetical protein [Gemmataceae bacterium]
MHSLTCSHTECGHASQLSASISPTTDATLHWYRFSGADAIFLIVALLVFLTARQGLLDDPGLGWHLRNIDAMLAQGGWLTVDPFSEPRNGKPQPWLTNQWLGEIPFWLGERWAGLEGIAAVAALIIAFTMRCLYRMLLRDGSPWPVAVFWTSQAAMGVSCSWVARPNLFTLLFVLLTARICILFHEGRCSRRATLWLLPLFAVWANIHGGFVAGLTILGATLVIETALALFSARSDARAAARYRSLHLFLLLAGAILATLINPYCLRLYRWIFQLLGDPFFMDLHQEWRSPDFHGKGAIRFEWLMLLFPFLLAVSKRRPNLVELGLALMWFHFALTGFRYVPLWVVIAVPLLARSSLEMPWLQEQAQRLFAAGEGGCLLTVSPARASWLGSLLGAVLLLAMARCTEGRLARHQPDILPTDALNRFLRLHVEWRQKNGRRPVVFHSYDWGGYLTWHGGPDFRNWIDDRNEVQGKEHIQEYFSILGTEPGWCDNLDQADVQLICVQSNAPLTFRLAEQSHVWCERYRDDWAVIFERSVTRSRDPSDSHSP